MRLTAGSYGVASGTRLMNGPMTLWGSACHGNEPRWHNASSGMSEEGIFDLPAGFPHFLQGLGPDGTEFLCVFNQGSANFTKRAPCSFRSGLPIRHPRCCEEY